MVVKVKNLMIKSKDRPNVYEFECPYCKNISQATIYSITHGAGCNSCKGKRISAAKYKTHEEYINELKTKNPLVQVNEEYKGDAIKIKHTCSICKRTDWLVSPSNVLRGTSFCSKCNNSRNNSLFSEIAQQYLSAIGVAEIEFDIGYKTLSYYDLYIKDKNLLIEIQSAYHDNKINTDLDKKRYAESLGYNVEWVDIRNTDIMDFIHRFDNDATWDDILKKIDLCKMLVIKIVQLDINGNLIKVFNGGMAEASTMLSLSISRLSLACKGKHGKQGHFYGGFLWYHLNEYKSSKFKIQKVSKEQIERYNAKNKVYTYIATKDEEIVTAKTAKELGELIDSNGGLVIACIKGRREHTRGYKISRII